MMLVAALDGSSGGDSSVTRLLDQARQGDGRRLGELLQLYRNYLNVLATTQLDRKLRRRMNPSDVVQETMLAAHRDFAKFRGATEGELLAWLRQILSHCISHAVEANVLAKKRDVRREVELDRTVQGIDDSIATLASLLPAATPSPSEDYGRRELTMQLSNELAKLKPEYRDVIVFRNLQGLSFDEIAARMNRTSGAVRMMWLRAIERFKTVCEPIR